jgi:peptidoglycan hydrolase-like amidase
MRAAQRGIPAGGGGMSVRNVCSAALVAALALPAADVRVAVFGLFHPRRVETVRLRGDRFLLRVPGRIERRFEGRLQLVLDAGEVIPVVTMDIETAVASIVAAESPPGAALDSLKAQAVVARSYLVAAGPRHPHSDFCDTTHCQFLREPPGAASSAALATRATAGIVLVHEGRVIEALYSADCGGETREFTAGPYPYFAVSCPVRSGLVAGHRLGLCQVGAAAMARGGATWREILDHYFPAAAVSLSAGRRD